MSVYFLLKSGFCRSESRATMAEDNNINNTGKEEQSAIDYEGRWKRALADYENYKKDETKRFVAFSKFSKAEVIRELLPLIDMLERALQEVPAETEKSPWVEGVVRIHEEFLRFLNKEGVKKIETIGQEFDPKYHETVGRTDETGEDVVEEVRSGFVTNDDFIIRPAQVKIGKIKR